MNDVTPTRIVGDLSHLPESAMGARNIVWWGNIGFMAIEGTAFLLAIGTYFYLMSQSPAWPPSGDRPPDLIWGIVFTAGLAFSMMPNIWVLRAARRKDAGAVRVGVLLMAIIGAALFVPRAFELAHLNVPWHQDAYGSVLWMLMVLHTSHIVTDWGDTCVQALWLYTHEIGDDQFADVEDNSNYWTFVVLTWIPIAAIVYLAPRLG
ncbi:cytochrome C oxidase subunit III [Sphingomonas sp.]|uniref:cytochrome C oxidase subunit III n=1 Tax=Sphingomonas sp. TaxID=28214 RepID=UPI003B3A09E4